MPKRIGVGFGLNTRLAWVVLFALLLFGSLLFVDWRHIPNKNAGSGFGTLLTAFLAPDLSIENLQRVTSAVWITVSYAVTSLFLAALIGLPLGIIASGVVIGRSKPLLPLAIATRAWLGLTRSVHELIWALIFVAVIGLSPVAGIAAIALPYSGIIGRIFAERLQDVPDPQIVSVGTAGANGVQSLLLARIPSVLPDIISYLFYRLECAIRTASVLSFVGLGGIGFQVHIAMSDLKFDTVATLFYSLLLLILIVDLMSRTVRSRILS